MEGMPVSGRENPDAAVEFSLLIISDIMNIGCVKLRNRSSVRHC